MRLLEEQHRKAEALRSRTGWNRRQHQKKPRGRRLKNDSVYRAQGGRGRAQTIYDYEEEYDMVVESLRSDKSQRERTNILNAFKRGKITLIATGVAAAVWTWILLALLSTISLMGRACRASKLWHRIGRTARETRQDALSCF